jgi:hypothetical protein
VTDWGEGGCFRRGGRHVRFSDRRRCWVARGRRLSRGAGLLLLHQPLDMVLETGVYSRGRCISPVLRADPLPVSPGELLQYRTFEQLPSSSQPSRLPGYHAARCRILLESQARGGTTMQATRQQIRDFEGICSTLNSYRYQRNTWCSPVGDDDSRVKLSSASL